MKIRLTKDCLCDGQLVNAGEILDLEDHRALQAIADRNAEAVIEEKEEPKKKVLAGRK